MIRAYMLLLLDRLADISAALAFSSRAIIRSSPTLEAAATGHSRFMQQATLLRCITGTATAYNQSTINGLAKVAPVQRGSRTAKPVC